MQYFAYANTDRFPEHAFQATLGICPDSNNGFGLQDSSERLQKLIAARLEHLGILAIQFVGRDVSSPFVHEDERAIIRDEMLLKEGVWSREPFREETPKSSPRDFGFLTSESFDRTLGMLFERLRNRGMNLKIVSDRCDLAKWNPRLRHPKRAWIHS